MFMNSFKEFYIVQTLRQCKSKDGSASNLIRRMEAHWEADWQKWGFRDTICHATTSDYLKALTFLTSLPPRFWQGAVSGCPIVK